MSLHDIRQSPLYARNMERIGWKVEQVGKWYAYIRRFPLIGSFIKIQRINPPVPLKEINHLVQKYRAFRVVVELNYESRITNYELRKWKLKTNVTSYAPSKTIHIDLTADEDEIFQRFNEAKRRAVRRAIKNQIIVQESDNIEEFISLKIKQDFLFSWLMKRDLQALWQVFRPDNAQLILAYTDVNQELRIKNQGNNDKKIHDSYFMIHNSKDNGQQIVKPKPVSGILLLIFDHVAYYWQAAATKEGKKLFAPTLLVWETLKLAKKRGCKIFDFEGVYDERFPKATKNWKGFTKFKEGFGGKEVYYPQPLVK